MSTITSVDWADLKPGDNVRLFPAAEVMTYDNLHDVPKAKIKAIDVIHEEVEARVEWNGTLIEATFSAWHYSWWRESSVSPVDLEDTYHTQLQAIVDQYGTKVPMSVESLVNTAVEFFLRGVAEGMDPGGTDYPHA